MMCSAYSTLFRRAVRPFSTACCTSTGVGRCGAFGVAVAEARLVETLVGTALIAARDGVAAGVFCDDETRALGPVRCAPDEAECDGAEEPTPEWPESPGAAEATAPSTPDAMKNPAPTANASAPT
ncbi:hypothetical protein MHPYR_270048 [uncultured Mycobacterium sp.]|uniref:Uncharacterized protein n=1 Tax=uncultured Mycobacterium sp. TaxID=171292 RepID=A0A1Y5PAV7_9MYCO|nr:hypothetical protein MHPYR_270048 [uncultured Mycobacterium sp.]